MIHVPPVRSPSASQKAQARSSQRDHASLIDTTRCTTGTRSTRTKSRSVKTLKSLGPIIPSSPRAGCCCCCSSRRIRSRRMRAVFWLVLKYAKVDRVRFPQSRPHPCTVRGCVHADAARCHSILREKFITEDADPLPHEPIVPSIANNRHYE